MSKYELFRYCSSCEIEHRIKDGMCEGCYEVQCPSCKRWSKIKAEGSIKCSSCRKEIPVSEKARERMTHPPNLDICPKCKRKLRRKARDKRRSFGIKATA